MSENVNPQQQPDPNQGPNQGDDSWSQVPDPNAPYTQPGYQQSAGPSQGDYQWTPPQGAPRRGPQASGFFNSIRNSGFFRSSSRILGGVCGGLAAKFGWDPAVVRLVTAVALIPLFGWVVIAYGAAWILLPDQADGKILAESWTSA